MHTSRSQALDRATHAPFSRVLVPLDGSPLSERALAPATALALAAGASMWPVSAALASEAPDRLAYLRRLAAKLAAPCVEPEVLDSDGAAYVIESLACSYNRLHGGLAVCMSTQAKTAIPELVLGSTAASVVRSGVAPVVLVGPEMRRRWSLRSLVVCHDGSAFAAAAMPLAAMWARSMGLRCWVVQALEAKTRKRVDAADTAHLRDAAEALRRQGIRARWNVLRGSSVTDAILSFTDKRAGAMVAMATHGRSGLDRVTMGSTAVDVVRHSHVPVLVYHP